MDNLSTCSPPLPPGEGPGVRARAGATGGVPASAHVNQRSGTRATSCLKYRHITIYEKPIRRITHRTGTGLAATAARYDSFWSR